MMTPNAESVKRPLNTGMQTKPLNEVQLMRRSMNALRKAAVVEKSGWWDNFKKRASNAKDAYDKSAAASKKKRQEQKLLNDIFLAVEQNRTDIIKQFVRQGGDINQVADIGTFQTPLMYAIGGRLFTAKIETIEMLVRAGAKLSSFRHTYKREVWANLDKPEEKPRRETETIRVKIVEPLLFALICGKPEIARKLIELGAPTANMKDWINDAMKNKAHAVAHRKAQGPEFIYNAVLAGFNVDYQDPQGQTLLHYAFANKKGELARFLLDKGAKTDIKDKFGETAVDVAKQNGFEM